MHPAVGIGRRSSATNLDQQRHVQLLWYQMGMADAGAGPADRLIEALDHALASKLCTGVILSFTRACYRAWERSLAATLVSRLYAAGMPYYVELWLWPEHIAAATPYRPETYHDALTTLEQVKRACPGCIGTALDTEGYGDYQAVLNADPDRISEAMRTVLDTDGPLSAPPADLLYPARCTSGIGRGYAMYEPLGRRRITEDTYYTNGSPPPTWVPPTPHEGRAYFVWPTHGGRFWTPEMLFAHTPWKWSPPVDLAMLYGGGHPWLAAAALRNYAEADLSQRQVRDGDVTTDQHIVGDGDYQR